MSKILNAYKSLNGLCLYRDLKASQYVLFEPNEDLFAFGRNPGILAEITVVPMGKCNTIQYSRALHGYGPPLYIIAMQEATRLDHWLASDVNGMTSSDAQIVWDRFLVDSENPSSGIIRIKRSAGHGNSNLLNTTDGTDFMYQVTRQLIDASILYKNYNDFISNSIYKDKTQAWLENHFNAVWVGGFK